MLAKPRNSAFLDCSVSKQSYVRNVKERTAALYRIPQRPRLKYHYSGIKSPQALVERPLPPQFSLLSPMAALALSRHQRLCLSKESAAEFTQALQAIRHSEFPLTATLAAARFKGVLSPHELSEVTEYSLVYFLGPQAAKPAPPFLDRNGFYAASVADHIAYRYEIVEEIGTGAFGKVLRCYDHRSSTLVAIKVLRNEEQAAQEIAVLSQVSDADTCIVKYLSHFAFRGHVCIVLESLDISLLEHMQNYQKGGIKCMKTLRKITFQVLQALSCLHDRGMAHADIKPENILFTDHNRTDIKLIDFGSTTVCATSDLDYVQSRHYRAPEIALGCPYTQAIDMWSLGCLLYECYTGEILFPADSEVELLSMVEYMLGPAPISVVNAATRSVYAKVGRLMRSRSVGPISSEKTVDRVLGRIDLRFKNFVTSLLKWEPSARLTVETALHHPWLYYQL